MTRVGNVGAIEMYHWKLAPWELDVLFTLGITSWQLGVLVTLGITLWELDIPVILGSNSYILQVQMERLSHDHK